MLINKISATSSTNTYLKSLLSDKQVQDELVIVAEDQINGRGQMGSVWQSERSKNLTFSMYKQFDDFDVKRQFYLSKVVSIAIKEVLDEFAIPEIKIKWPNDILSANQKICGILIENILQGNKIKGSIIGVGLNVNQMVFSELPNATSMKIVSNKDFDLDLLLNKLIQKIAQKSALIQKSQFYEIDNEYLNCLYRINQLSVFENNKSQKFNGIIRGVSEEGKLLIETEEQKVLPFGLKELKLISGLK